MPIQWNFKVEEYFCCRCKHCMHKTRLDHAQAMKLHTFNVDAAKLKVLQLQWLNLMICSLALKLQLHHFTLKREQALNSQNEWKSHYGKVHDILCSSEMVQVRHNKASTDCSQKRAVFLSFPNYRVCCPAMVETVLRTVWISGSAYMSPFPLGWRFCSEPPQNRMSHIFPDSF